MSFAPIAPTPGRVYSYIGEQLYPYLEPLRHQGSQPVPTTVAEAITAAEAPVIEIGGPTPRGFRLLQGSVMLPGRAYITNVQRVRGAEAHVDGTDMPFPSRSIGVFLASHLAYTDFIGLRTADPDLNQDEAALRAEAEYVNLLGDPDFMPRYNLRLMVLREMSRTLVKGGVAVFEGVNSSDILAARTLGHDVLFQRSCSDTLQDCVLQKH